MRAFILILLGISCVSGGLQAAGQPPGTKPRFPRPEQRRRLSLLDCEPSLDTLWSLTAHLQS